MENIPITYLNLQLPLAHSHVPNLRSSVMGSVLQHKAVFEAAGVSTDVFHNHKEGDEEEKYRRYPLVQYKVWHKKAEIIGIGRGAKAVQLWLPLAGDQLSIKQKIYPLKGKLRNATWKPTILKEEKVYRINKWMPLNAENYKYWSSTPKLSERVTLLDKVLWGHIFQLLDDMEININRKKLSLYLSTIDMQTYEESYRIKRLALDVTFRSNLELPEEIGLGQGVSIGFGKVQGIKVKEKEVASEK